MDEKRRQEALKYLVEKGWASRKREEELRRKIEKMSRLRRHFYRVFEWFKDYSSFFREGVSKPVSLTIIFFTPWINLIFICAFNWKVASFISNSVPQPFSIPIICLTSVAWAFAPFITPLEIYRYREKKRTEKMAKEEFGIKLSRQMKNK